VRFLCYVLCKLVFGWLSAILWFILGASLFCVVWGSYVVGAQFVFLFCALFTSVIVWTGMF